MIKLLSLKFFFWSHLMRLKNMIYVSTCLKSIEASFTNSLNPDVKWHKHVNNQNPVKLFQ